MYLLRSDGTIESYPDAVTAELDGDVFILRDRNGQVVVIFDHLAVTMYSPQPFAAGATQPSTGGQSEPA